MNVQTSDALFLVARMCKNQFEVLDKIICRSQSSITIQLRKRKGL